MSFDSGVDWIVIVGFVFVLCLKVVVVLVMVLYELGINVVKYGVLLVDEGYVDLIWNLIDDGFVIEWNECNGLFVVLLSCWGFGVWMIDWVLVSDFDGKVEMIFVYRGLYC